MSMRLHVAALAVLTLVMPPAIAQSDWPSRPIRIVVPFPPGGVTDMVGRLTADALGRSLGGKAVVVENIGGAGGTVGTDRVAKSAHDGHTLLIATLAANATAPSVYAKLPYDPTKDFAYIAPLTFSSNALLVNPKLGIHSLADLVAHGKAHPGKLTFSSPGHSTSNYLAMELFLAESGVTGLHVPYKGAGQAVAAVLSGEVQMTFDPVASSLPHLRSGALRALAVSGRARSPLLADIPTVAEAGVRNVEAYTWNGLAAPAGTPRAIVDRLHTEITTAFAQPELRDRLTNMGSEPIDMKPAEFQAFIGREAEKWGAIARRVGAKAE